jgi:hypothetical protein
VDLTVVLPLALAGLVVAALALFLQRASGALRATRNVERFQHEAAALGVHLDERLALVITQVDAVRRHETDASGILDDLAATAAVLDEGLSTAEGLDAPALYAASRAGIISEIGHAQRALDMVRHGCELAAGPRARMRSTEAQIAVKRGYLNLLHAREALAGHVADLAAARDPAQSNWRTFRV